MCGRNRVSSRYSTGAEEKKDLLPTMDPDSVSLTVVGSTFTNFQVTRRYFCMP